MLISYFEEQCELFTAITQQLISLCELKNNRQGRKNKLECNKISAHETDILVISTVLCVSTWIRIFMGFHIRMLIRYVCSTEFSDPVFPFRVSTTSVLLLMYLILHSVNTFNFQLIQAMG